MSPSIRGNVLIVPGGKVTMFFAVLIFGEPGAEILYPNPGFPIYESVINFTGAKAVPIPLYESNGFSFSAEEVLAKITPNTRLIILNSPANPTGGAVPREEFDRLVKGLEDHPQVFVMSDEIYSRMLYDGREHVSLLGYESIRDRLILLDGWSKTYAMTGWRMGYSVWPDSLIEKATRLCINCHSCVNAVAQQAGIEALRGPQDAVTAMVAAFDERRKVVVEELNSIPVSAASNRAAPSMPSRTLPAPASARASYKTFCWKRPGWRPCRAPVSGPTARATCVSPTPTASRTSARPCSASAITWRREAEFPVDTELERPPERRPFPFLPGPRDVTSG